MFTTVLLEAGGAYCEKGWENLCLDSIDWHPLGIAFEVVLLLYAFLGLAIVCDEYLVPSLETLCLRWGVREDVAGASFMAFGSAAPEIIINAVTTVQGAQNVELGVGAIIGSGMIAFMCIPSACTLFSGSDEPLIIKRRPLLRDVLFYSSALAALCVFFADGVIDLPEAGVLISLYALYILVVFFSPKVRTWWFLRQLPDAESRSTYLLQRSVSFVTKSASNSVAGSRRGTISALDVETAAAAAYDPEPGMASAVAFKTAPLPVRRGPLSLNAVPVGGSSGAVNALLDSDDNDDDNNNDVGSGVGAGSGTAKGSQRRAVARSVTFASDLPAALMGPTAARSDDAAAADAAAVAAEDLEGGVRRLQVSARAPPASARAEQEPPRSGAEDRMRKPYPGYGASGRGLVRGATGLNYEPPSLDGSEEPTPPPRRASSRTGTESDAGDEEEDGANGRVVDTCADPYYGSVREGTGVIMIDDTSSIASSDEDDGPPTALGRAAAIISWPLHFLLKYTCPHAVPGGPWERWYLLSFLISFLWVALFAMIISAVVGQWVEKANVSIEFFGLVLVALGAEIPDMIQSVTVARRGYGSMATSNCIGSQITNILVGLGLPWFISIAATGKPIIIAGHEKLFRAALIQSANIGVFFAVTLGVAFIAGRNKVLLTRAKGRVNLALYFVSVGIFAFITFCTFSWCSSRL
jgi:K+-dependent Na+/Ca+ exchanger-like protein